MHRASDARHPHKDLLNLPYPNRIGLVSLGRKSRVGLVQLSSVGRVDKERFAYKGVYTIGAVSWRPPDRAWHSGRDGARGRKSRKQRCRAHLSAYLGNILMTRG